MTTDSSLLLIEDSQDLAQLIQMSLTRSGYSVTVANTAAFAKIILEHKNFDMIVSDVGLPDESGLSLMKNLREAAFPSAPTFALAISAFDNLEKDIKAAGFDGFLKKPFRGETLIQKIESILASDRSAPSKN